MALAAAASTLEEREVRVVLGRLHQLVGVDVARECHVG
jgi:hypothetical protein